MSLIKQISKYPVYKPMKYPEAYEYYKKHESLHWLPDEVPLGEDVKDFRSCTFQEQAFITNILRLFTQNDVMVGSGYDTLLRIFKPTEVNMMLRSYAARENIHIDGYSNLIDTLGLPETIYTEFLDIPIMEVKVDYVAKARVKKLEYYTSMGLTEMEADVQFRKDVARMLAVYSTLTEGVSLFAQFAILLHYQLHNKFKGMCQIVTWSIRDEEEHCQGNAWLFRQYIRENLDIWNDDIKRDIYKACKQIVSNEHILIDYLYANGECTTLDIKDIKQYVMYIADRRLQLIGLKPIFNVTNNPLPFMDELLGSTELANFFEARATEYSKAAMVGNWSEIR